MKNFFLAVMGSVIHERAAEFFPGVEFYNDCDTQDGSNFYTDLEVRLLFPGAIAFVTSFSLSV